MVRRLSPLFSGVVFIALLSGCGIGKLSGMQPRPVGKAPEKRQVSITANEEARSSLRARERHALEQKIQARRADFSRDTMEQNARNAIALTLGQRAAASESASTSIKALRAANMRLRIDASSETFDLRADGEETPRSTRKNARAKEKDKDSGSPVPDMEPSVAALRQQVRSVARAARAWNEHVQLDGLQATGAIAGMVQSRKKMRVELEDGDYEIIRSYLEIARTDEAIAASMLALAATYQAVINDGADPKAIDTVAESTSQAFPIRVTVTTDDAKAYVAALRPHVTKLKTRYEAALRKSFGDERYELTAKAKLEAAFPGSASNMPADDSDALPGGNAIMASIVWNRATKSGDAKSALAAASALEPVPALKRIFTETSMATAKPR